MVLFAGLDGGASKTRVRIVDMAGALIGEGKAGPGSLTISPEFAAANALKALEQALMGSGFALADCRLVCGLAGHRQPERCAVFKDLMSDVGAIEVISDGYAALLGAHGGAAGAIVIAGTGSAGLSLDLDGKVRQIGGWGPVAGDEGGGNWLGRQAVRLALRAHDLETVSGSKPSALLEAIYKELGGKHETILAWLANADATRFGGLAPIIVQHAEHGDLVALALLNEAASEISRLIRLASYDGRLPVALIGGLADILAPRIDQALSPTSPLGCSLDGALRRASGVAPPEVYHQKAA